jgi:ABC-type antimicrobial peptide transport system permease subunit
MIRAFVSVPSGVELDNATYLANLDEIPGVTAVQGNVNYPMSWKLPDEEKFRDGFMRSFSEPFGEVPLEPPRLIEGNYPAAGQKQVVIERRMAEKHGLGVGDPLDMRILGGTAEGDETEKGVQAETWTIVGIVFHPYTYFGGPEGFIPNDASVYANYEDARYIAGFTGFSSIYARYVDYPTAQRESGNFLASVGEVSPYIVVFNFMEDPADNIMIRISLQYTGVITTLAMLAMLVSGFLVINVISTIVLEQKRQIGVMKSLGATRWDNFQMYGGVALVYGLIGTVPGVLFGVPIGYWLAKFFAGSGPNAYIEAFSISPTGVGVGLAMGLLVPVLFSLIPVFIGTKVTILEAMTDLGIATGYGAGRIARLINALPLPINVRQALSNVLRKKWRMALTVLTLMFAVTSFMAVVAVVGSMNQAIGSVFDAYGYDIQVVPTDIQSFETIKGYIMDNVEGVGAVYPSSGLALQVEGYTDQFLGGDQLQVIGIDPTTDSFRLDLKEGTAWQENPERQGIVLSTGVAEQLGKGSGDTLVVAVGGKSVELEIIGVDRFPFDAAFMEWRALAEIGGLFAGGARPGEYMAMAQAEGYGDTAVVGLEVDERMSMLIQEGANLSGDRPEVIITTDMAQKGGYQVGDELTLTVSGNTATYPIVGILQLPPGALPEGQPADFVGMFWEQLAQLEGREFGDEPAPNALLIRLEDPEATAVQADEVIAAISEVLANQGITAQYTNQIAAVEQNAEDMLMFGMIFNMTSFVMAAVGAIGLLSTLSMSVFERQKEIGVMRSIGAGSGTVAGQFLVEGLLVGVIAWLVGLPLSYVLGQVLLQVMPFGFVEYTYPLINPVIGLVGMLVIATVSSLWPSISAARKTVSEIIRYQ